MLVIQTGEHQEDITHVSDECQVTIGDMPYLDNHDNIFPSVVLFQD